MKTIAEHLNDNLFDAANFKGRMGLFVSKLTGTNNRLSKFESNLRGKVIENTSYAGLSAIPIDEIRGTFGKQNDFDLRFRPLNERSRERWLDIFNAKVNGKEMPPVDLVKLGEVYFVRDGHHRISVSRSLGQSYVDAEVTVVCACNYK